MQESRTQPYSSTETEASKASGDGLQAMLSGVVFGALGAIAGNWLGAKGGEHGPRMFGKKVMTWIGGVTTGLVAVYVSLKSSAEQKEAERPDEERVIIRKPLMETRAVGNPLPQVQMDEAVLHGQTAPMPEKEMAR